VVLNTQVGAESVTNPDGTSLPEIVNVDVFSFGNYPELIEGSSRLPTGEFVLAWDSEYKQLTAMMKLVAQAYRAQFSNKVAFQLDFEYKKVQPGVLELKQVREIPLPKSTNIPSAYLLADTVSLRVFQGECG